MALSRHHLTALIGATLASIIALYDALMHGVTGRSSVFTDEAAGAGWLVTGGLVHAFAYAVLAWVLVRERPRFERANRFARVLRYVLIASLAVLAAGFAVLAPVLHIGKVPTTGPLGTAWEWIAGIGFAGMILSSLLLGIAVLRNNPLGYGGRLLGLLVPVLAVTVLLGFVAPAWSHPGYIETVIHFGLALTGVLAGTTTGAEPPHGAGTEPDERQMELGTS